jgi:hypothetical protein
LFATVNVASGPFKLGDVVQGSVEFPIAEEEKPTCIQVIIHPLKILIRVSNCSDFAEKILVY